MEVNIKYLPVPAADVSASLVTSVVALCAKRNAQITSHDAWRVRYGARQTLKPDFHYSRVHGPSWVNSARQLVPSTRVVETGLKSTFMSIYTRTEQ